MTNLPNRTRIAGLAALALSLCIAALPAQASGFTIQMGNSGRDSLPILQSGGEDDHDRDCLSRQEIKYLFKSEYYLSHVDVERASERHLYLVSGYRQAKEEAALGRQSLLRQDTLPESGSGLSGKKIHYVFLFDACHEQIVKQLKPSRSEM